MNASDTPEDEGQPKRSKRRMPKGGWPLLNDQPPMKEWHVVAEMSDGGKYRVTVVARLREEACREIVHTQMAKGCAVKRIYDVD